MKDLLKLRKCINHIDQKQLSLFKKRMSISKRIGKIKILQSKPVFDQKREQEIISKNLEKLNDFELSYPYYNFFSSIITSSKEIQIRERLPKLLNSAIDIVYDIYLNYFVKESSFDIVYYLNRSISKLNTDYLFSTNCDDSVDNNVFLWSTNFIDNKSNCPYISLLIQKDNLPYIGVIYNILTGDILFSEKGTGLYYNYRQISSISLEKKSIYINTNEAIEIQPLINKVLSEKNYNNIEIKKEPFDYFKLIDTNSIYILNPNSLTKKICSLFINEIHPQPKIKINDDLLEIKF